MCRLQQPAAKCAPHDHDGKTLPEADQHKTPSPSNQKRDKLCVIRHNVSKQRVSPGFYPGKLFLSAPAVSIATAGGARRGGDATRRIQGCGSLNTNQSFA
jgi:hypothetical protein